jgi:aspartyl-tRNA(Asn)/glutamyl-tRNA(Gln) amidotransferase subunit C
MSLSDDQLRCLARLARIAIQAQESAEVAGRLNQVLGLVDQMRRVDATGVEPMAHALESHLSLLQRLRPDAVTEPDRRAAYQAVAPVDAGGNPQVQDGLYLVPKVIE